MLPFHAIQELHQAAVDAHLAPSRAELLGGIVSSVVASLPTGASPAAQLLSDLHELNRIERLTDGSAPLAAWLTNAVTLTRGRPQEAIFRRLLKVASTWATVPIYPDAETRFLSEQIEAARRRESALARAGEDTAAIKREILDLRRQLREGGRLRAGDALGEGRYLLLQEIGRGGFASVWRARDELGKRNVALKVLHNSLVGDSVPVGRFFRGAKVMAGLEHAAVVRVLQEHGQEGGYYFFVMEYIDGTDLRRAVIEKRLRPEQVLPVILQIGAALGEAHAKGIVHRDVKPANILLDAMGVPKLTDFDLVVASDTTGGTRTGAIGTFLYAAPELMARPQDADARADVFALGMTAIFCLSGAELTKEALRQPDQLIETLPCAKAIKEVLARAVEWDAARRYADARAFCEALFEGMHEEASPAEVSLYDVALRSPEGGNVEALLTSGMRALRSGHLDESYAAFRDALAAVDIDLPTNPRNAMVALIYQLTRARLRGLAFVERPEHEVPPEDLFRIDTCWVAHDGFSLVELVVSYYIQTRILRLALKAGEPHRIARALAQEAGYLSSKGGPAQRRTSRLLHASHEIARRLNDPYTLACITESEGMTAILEGRWQAGYDALERAEGLFQDCPTRTGMELVTLRWWALWSLGYLGNLVEMSRRVSVRLRDANSRGDSYATLSHSTGLAGLVWLAADRPGEARERARDALARWSQTKFSVEIWWKVLGECQTDLYQGDAKAACRAVKELWDSLSGTVYLTVQLTKLEVLHLRARCSLMRAMQKTAERNMLCNEILLDARRMEKERMPWASPLATLLRAGAAAAQGDNTQAVTLLRDAATGLQTANMALYAAAARYHEGKLLGGDEGRAIWTQADQWMSSQGVVNREKMVAMLAPGFE